MTKIQNEELTIKTNLLSEQVNELANNYDDSVKEIDNAVRKDKNIAKNLVNLQSTAEVIVVNSNNVLNSLINAEEDLKAVENANITSRLFEI